ncbi:NADH-quinone oxidoreductase subunit NuoG [Ilumatobacter coccineus]|uniref:NADH-quinone oxidoreductase n=1 Tax=Ilumatobacter coccineus (strain NBRC 103263 / KCTC 29153 / YM16-304) TaxID=1313172 RepID=A0A6C7E9K4_ILUCY|nr:NADH-quinone oxidoreductase subunit NuoG [Ilumatobacter coccineus]BAN00726.1 NADH-quinone oxidoreductase subunit G [Ilumatobacter coccineus YM16-304]
MSNDETTADTADDATDATNDEAAHAEQASDVAVDDEVEAVEEEPEPDPNVVQVTLNGRQIDARKGELVIAAAERHDTYIPHFCYHPRMKSVGMCRQCLVEVDTGRGMQLQPSCMISVSPDMVIDTESDTTKRAQEGMLELLLANHPLDCPVCDKGGECPLQDQAFSHGPGESRYVEEKRHYEKPIAISDLVLLDRERCILCDRCTRFADEVAGDKLIHFTQRGNETQVMTFPDEPFASYFSGNTVQICPVGALTAEPYRFKARPWDLDQNESTCTTCSVGCRTVVQSSRDELLRYQGVDSDSVNHGWLCDRGRFDFEAVNSEHRLAEPMVNTEAGQVATSWNAAMATTVEIIQTALSAGGPSSIGILGGARGTNEDAFAWSQLADALGVTHRDAQLGDGLPVEVLGLNRATIDEAANASTIIVLGPDIKEELPVLYLRLRDAVQEKRSKLIEIAAVDTGLTRYAWKSVRHQPGLQSESISELLADADVQAQIASGDVVVVAGRPNLAESADATVAALSTLLAGVPDAKVLPALRRGNVVGALSVGMAPADGDHDGLATLRAAADGKLELLILLGADPLNDCPDADLARRALAGARRVVSIDTHPTESSKLADVVLAAAAYGEKAGTTTNIEGRVTSLAAKVTTTGTARPDWMIASELASMLDVDGDITDVVTVDDITAAIAETVPGFGAIAGAAAAGTEGVLTEVQSAELPAVSATALKRNSFDYRLVVSRKLYDRAIGTAMSHSLAKLAPGAAAHVHPLDLDQLGVAEGGDVKLIGPKATAVLPVVANPAIARGVVWAPFNQGGGNVEDIIDSSAAVVDVQIEVV